MGGDRHASKLRFMKKKREQDKENAFFGTHTHTCTNLLLGLSKGIEVSQHGVSVVFVLLPEVDSRLSGEDVLHALSGSLPHLNTGRQKQYISTQTACPSALTHL